MLGNLKQEQKQSSITIIKEKANKTELQEQEQHNIIVIKSPDLDIMGEMSKSEPDNTVYNANKEKMGEAKKFKKINEDKNIISLKERTKIKKKEQKKATDLDSIIFKIENEAKSAITMLDKPEFEELPDKLRWSSTIT